MGDDDERPSNPDNSSVFTSEYDGSGDFWVVGQIPIQDGVNEETYSCVWGMKNVGSTTDTNFYESTNSQPLRARDGGREDITYDELENRYAANTPTDTGRSVWGHYKVESDTSTGRDERSYISGTDNYLFANEVPYCDTGAWIGNEWELSYIMCQ